MTYPSPEVRREIIGNIYDTVVRCAGHYFNAPATASTIRAIRETVERVEGEFVEAGLWHEPGSIRVYRDPYDPSAITLDFGEGEFGTVYASQAEPVKSLPRERQRPHQVSVHKSDKPTSLKWRKGDPQSVLKLLDSSRPFATVDPGADGAAVIFVPSVLWRSEREPVPSLIYRIKGLDGAREFARQCRKVGVEELIIEEPFVARGNPQSALTLSRNVGFILGAFHSFCAGSLSVLVPAQSWQSVVIPRALGPREKRKAMMCEIASDIMKDDARWDAAGDEQKRAIADAIGIAIWRAKLDNKGT